MSVSLAIVRKLVLSEIRTHTIELPVDLNDWPEDWYEEYLERAAIMEFDGNLAREEADQWAETIVRAAYRVKWKEQ